MQREISNILLSRFIMNDEIYLEKLLRKLLIIKQRKEHKLLLFYLYKWFTNLYIPSKDINKEMNEKNNKKKVRNNIDKKIYKNENQNKNQIKNKKNKTDSYIKNNKKETKKFFCSIITNNSTPNFSSNSLKNIKINIFDKQIFPIEQNKISKISNSLSRFKKSIANNSLIYSRKKILKKINKTEKNKNLKQYRQLNKKLITDFLINLEKNEKDKKEKMIKLKKIKEEKINSIYTFSPKILHNKSNRKYLKKLIDKLLVNNIMIDIDNKMELSNQLNKSINDAEDSNNKEHHLDIVFEENRKNKNLDFISRLNEYEKRRKNNLEKIKYEIYLNENKKNLENYFFNNNDRFNIENSHLMNSTSFYFFNKKRNIEKMEKIIFDEQGITFKPKVNKEYNKKIKKRYDNLNKEEYINKKNKKIMEYLSKIEKECTFQPRINSLCFNISESNELKVSERLFGYQHKYRKNLDLIKERYGNFSFKPVICKNTNAILNKGKLIQHFKEQIKSPITDSNKEFLTNQNENNDEEKKSLSNNKLNNKDFNLEIFEKNEEKEKNQKFKISQKKNNRNFKQKLEDNENKSYTYDFKKFIHKIEKNKNDFIKNKNSKKIMNLKYYENIL